MSKKKMIKGFVYLIQKNNKFLFYTRPLGTILGGTVSLPINNWQDYGDEDDHDCHDHGDEDGHDDHGDEDHGPTPQ